MVNSCSGCEALCCKTSLGVGFFGVEDYISKIDKVTIDSKEQIENILDMMKVSIQQDIDYRMGFFLGTPDENRVLEFAYIDVSMDSVNGSIEFPYQIGFRCPELQGNFLCGDYESRPSMCKSFSCSRVDSEGVDYGSIQALNEGVFGTRFLSVESALEYVEREARSFFL